MIKKIDHFVITTTDIDQCLQFYKMVGFEVHRDGDRFELLAGDFKINVHILNHELSPHAKNIQPGSADLCLEIEGNLEEWKNDILSMGIMIELGIVKRKGVRGIMSSFYVRDPDLNLIEFCSYQKNNEFM